MYIIIIKENDSELGKTFIFQIDYDDARDSIDFDFETLSELYLFDNIYKDKYSSIITDFHNLDSNTGIASYIFLYAEKMNIPIIERTNKFIKKLDYSLLIECDAINRGYTYDEMYDYIKFLSQWISHLKHFDEHKHISSYSKEIYRKEINEKFILTNAIKK